MCGQGLSAWLLEVRKKPRTPTMRICCDAVDADARHGGHAVGARSRGAAASAAAATREDRAAFLCVATRDVMAAFGS